MPATPPSASAQAVWSGILGALIANQLNQAGQSFQNLPQTLQQKTFTNPPLTGTPPWPTGGQGSGPQGSVASQTQPLAPSQMPWSPSASMLNWPAASRTSSFLAPVLPQGGAGLQPVPNTPVPPEQQWAKLKGGGFGGTINMPPQGAAPGVSIVGNYPYPGPQAWTQNQMWNAALGMNPNPYTSIYAPSQASGPTPWPQNQAGLAPPPGAQPGWNVAQPTPWGTYPLVNPSTGMWT